MIMRFLLTSILFINYAFGTGPQTIYVIQNASLLGKSSTGIALNHNLNAANINLTEEHISFSKNNSIYDLKGQKISFLNEIKKNKSFFSFETLSSSRIPIYDNSTSDDGPLGYFDSYWYAIEFSQSIDMGNYFNGKSNILLGYRIKANLYKLYTNKTTNYSIDLGLSNKINENINFGIVINNLGTKRNFNLNNQITGTYDGKPVLGIGINYLIPDMHLSLSADTYYRNSSIVNKVSLETNFLYLNCAVGMTSFEDYSDFSYGMSINLSDWKFIYGSLIGEDNTIGNQKAIEIVRKF